VVSICRNVLEEKQVGNGREARMMDDFGGEGEDILWVFRKFCCNLGPLHSRSHGFFQTTCESPDWLSRSDSFSATPIGGGINQIHQIHNEDILICAILPLRSKTAYQPEG